MDATLSAQHGVKPRRRGAGVTLRIKACVTITGRGGWSQGSYLLSVS
jgi:hypothetical protein